MTRATARKIESCERREEASAPAAREVHEWGGRRRTWKRFAPTESVASVTNTPMLRKSWRKMPVDEEEPWNAARERAEVGEGGERGEVSLDSLARTVRAQREQGRTEPGHADCRTAIELVVCEHARRPAVSSVPLLVEPALVDSSCDAHLDSSTISVGADVYGSAACAATTPSASGPNLELGDEERRERLTTDKGGKEAGSRDEEGDEEARVREPARHRGRARVSKSPRGRRRGGDEEGTEDAHRADAEAAVRHRRWTCAGWRRRADRRCSARGRARGWLVDLRPCGESERGRAIERVTGRRGTATGRW